MTDAIWSVEASQFPVSCMDISNDSRKLCFSNRAGEARVVSLSDGTELNCLTPKFSQTPIMGCRFHPCEERLVLVSTKDGYLMWYNLENSEILQMTRHLGGNVTGVAIDSFGDSFAISCSDGSIRVHDVENMQRTAALVKLTGRSIAQSTIFHDLVYHPEDANIILSAAQDRVFIWDLRTGNSERTIAGPHIRGTGLDVHQNTVYTASFRDTKPLETWDLGTGKKLKEFAIEARGGQLFTGKISRNGLVAICGGTSSIYSFDLYHGQEIDYAPPLGSPVICSAISQQGGTVCYGTENGMVKCHVIRAQKN